MILASSPNTPAPSRTGPECRANNVRVVIFYQSEYEVF